MWKHENLDEFLESHSSWIVTQAERHDKLGTLKGLSITNDGELLELIFEEGIAQYNFFLHQVGERSITQISAVR